MENIASIIGAISGCLSLVGIVYMLGVWRGKVDNQLNNWAQSFKDYPPAEMWTMTKTLWEIYVVDALHHRPDLAVHGSSFKAPLKSPRYFPVKPLDNSTPKR